jgi:putative endonuclease
MIIYSENADKFYIGQTMDIERREMQHNNKCFKDCSTKIAVDWTVFHLIECKSRKQAILIEKHIKKMRSRKYILNLKKYPDIAQRLFDKYNCNVF